MLSTTLTVIVPVLFVLLLGYFAWRAKALDAEQVTRINELTLDFALPASLFVGIASIPRTQLGQDASFIVAVLFDLVGVYLIALVIGTRILRLPTSAAALFALGASFPVVRFFGPVVLGGLFGAKLALAIASSAIIANLVLVPMTVVVLEVASRARHSHPKASQMAAAAGSSTVAFALPGSESARAAMRTVVPQSLFQAARQPYVWAPIIA